MTFSRKSFEPIASLVRRKTKHYTSGIQSVDQSGANPRGDLQAAYLKTTYRVCANGLEFDIFIGRVCSALDRWLGDNGWACWALLSAWNPGSRLLPGRINRVRHQKLVLHLVDQGRVWFPSVGIPSNSSWPAEQGVFVPDITVADARSVALRFGQNALVYGRRSTVARLLWCSHISPKPDLKSRWCLHILGNAL